MKLGDVLSQASSKLHQSNIEDPINEAAVLLGHTLGLDRPRLYAWPERELTPAEITTFGELIARRLAGEPAAYIIRSKEFYGIDLYVDRRVLVPRPETETLVDAVIRFTKSHGRAAARPWLIADTGTGSGAIAIALARHIPDSHIHAIDISPQALEVAAINVKRQGLCEKVTLLRGNLLGPLDHPVDIIAANLPYIADTDLATLPREVAEHEPGVALRGGGDGTVMIKELITQSKPGLLPGGAIFMEIGLGQGDEICRHAALVFARANISVIKDFAGIDRVISIVN